MTHPVQSPSNLMIGETLYLTRGSQIHRSFVNHIKDQVKGIASLTALTNANQYGCENVPDVQFDPKAPNLSESDLAAGRGTENTWHRRFAEEQTHAAGAGR
jgi:hypothetical protein